MTINEIDLPYFLDDGIKTKVFTDDYGNIQPKNIKGERQRIGLSQPILQTNYTPIENSPIVIKKYISKLSSQVDTVINFVETTGAITQENQFTFNRTTSEIVLHSTQKGKDITLEYQAKGLQLIGANRVYSKYDSQGNVIETLEELISQAYSALEGVLTLAELNTKLEQWKQDIRNITNLTKGLNTSAINGLAAKKEIDVTLAKIPQGKIEADEIVIGLGTSLDKGEITSNTIITNLNVKLDDGQVKANKVSGDVATALLQANDAINTITSTGNKTETITTAMWGVIDSITKLYKYRYTHTLNSQSIIIQGKYLDGHSWSNDYQFIDNRTIDFYNDTNDAIVITMSDKYYGGVRSDLSDYNTEHITETANKGYYKLEDKAKVTKLENDVIQVGKQLTEKASNDEVIKKGYATLNDFDEASRQALVGGDYNLNYVLGNESIKTGNIGKQNVTSSRTGFRSMNKETNQYDPDDLIKNGYYNNLGIWKDSTSVYSLPIIECNSTHTNLFINIYSFISFFDEQMVFIKGHINPNTSYATAVYPIPANSKYISVSTDPSKNTDVSKMFVLLSKIYSDTSSNLDKLKVVEYFDNNLILNEGNLKKVDVVTREEMVTEIEKIDNKYIDAKKDYIVLPDTIYTDGAEFYSWLNGCSIRKAFSNCRLMYLKNAVWTLHNRDFDGFDWNEVPNNLNVRVVFSNDKALYSKDIIVKKKTTLATDNLKWLPIGDSITNRGVANSTISFIKNRYNKTLVSIGTMNNTGNRKGEGREGWAYSDFIGNYITNNITALLTKGEGSLTKNPFVRITTELDKTENPKYCFSSNGTSYFDNNTLGTYYIFDFANYLALQEIETPDIITIALSTNDIIKSGADYLERCNLSLKFMLQQITKACPNVKIGIIPTLNFGMSEKGNEYQKKALKWVFECIKLVKDFNNENVYIIPTWANIERSTNFTVDVVGEVGETSNLSNISIIDDKAIHNNALSLHADCIAKWIANVIN